MTYEGSKRQLQEVLSYLAMHPFTEKPPVFGYPAQKVLYELGTDILTKKLLFFQVGMKEQEEARALREKTEGPPKIWENLTEEVKDENKENIVS